MALGVGAHHAHADAIGCGVPGAHASIPQVHPIDCARRGDVGGGRGAPLPERPAPGPPAGDPDECLKSRLPRRIGRLRLRWVRPDAMGPRRIGRVHDPQFGTDGAWLTAPLTIEVDAPGSPPKHLPAVVAAPELPCLAALHIFTYPR